MSLYNYIKQIPNHLSFISAPILILQSKKDTVVSPKSAEIIYEKVSSKDKRLVWFYKTNHEMLLDLERDKVIEEIMKFIREIIGKE